MTSSIIRVQGDAPELDWHKAMDSVVRDAHAAWTLRQEAIEREAVPYDLEVAVAATKRRAAERFAFLQEWVYSHRGFPLVRLSPLLHSLNDPSAPVYYEARSPGTPPRAVIIHEREGREVVWSALAGLVVDKLPAAWVRPDATAYVVRPPASSLAHEGPRHYLRRGGEVAR